MSIVAVHGPQTFGSKGVQEVGPVQVRPNPANGLQWTFQVDATSTRAAADFDWAFPTGTPATQADSKGPITVTYAAAGSKTATLTVTGAGTGANPYPPAGSYPITFTAVAGAAPQLMSAPGEEEEITEEVPVTEPAEAEPYDPGEHTVAEVQQYVIDHPDSLEAVYDAEYEGKGRATLVTWLEDQFPYDPGAWTVQEVIEYANANLGDLDEIIAAEQDGKNRTTLLTQLEALRPA